MIGMRIGSSLGVGRSRLWRVSCGGFHCVGILYISVFRVKIIR